MVVGIAGLANRRSWSMFHAASRSRHPLRFSAGWGQPIRTQALGHLIRGDRQPAIFRETIEIPRCKPLGSSDGDCRLPCCGSRMCRAIGKDDAVAAQTTLQVVLAKHPAAQTHAGGDRAIIDCHLAVPTFSVPRAQRASKAMRADRIVGSDRRISQVDAMPASSHTRAGLRDSSPLCGRAPTHSGLVFSGTLYVDMVPLRYPVLSSYFSSAVSEFPPAGCMKSSCLDSWRRMKYAGA
jgi:hypothetical protein